MTIAELINMLSEGKGAHFVSFTYRSKGTNELAKLVVALGHDTSELYKMDLEILHAILIGIDPEVEPIKYEACKKVIASRIKSLEVGIGNNPAYTHQDTYVYPICMKGFRVHKEEGTVYVSGLVQSKVTLEEGEYKEVKSKPLTIEKKKIEKDLPSGKYRMYILSNITSVHLNGNTLEIVTE